MEQAYSYEWQDKTILLVEDNDSIYFLINEILEDTKARLIWVKSGEDASFICQENRKIDLILMDMTLPFMNGIDATRKILSCHPDNRIIGVTAIDCRKAFLENGAIDYIQKPFTVSMLLNVLEKYLS